MAPPPPNPWKNKKIRSTRVAWALKNSYFILVQRSFGPIFFLANPFVQNHSRESEYSSKPTEKMLFFQAFIKSKGSDCSYYV